MLVVAAGGWKGAVTELAEYRILSFKRQLRELPRVLQGHSMAKAGLPWFSLATYYAIELEALGLFGESGI